MLVEINGRFVEDIGEIKCKNCGAITDVVYKYVESNNSIQARCLECGAFIKNIKQIEVIEGVDAEAPSVNQIFHIKQFYKKGLLPKTKKRASDLIHIMKKVDDDYDNKNI